MLDAVGLHSERELAVRRSAIFYNARRGKKAPCHGNGRLPMSALRFVSGWLLLLFTATVNAAPFLEGTVTDELGRPVAGVSVKIWDCVGTCLGGQTVLTDSDGHYVFETKPFRNFPLWDIDLPGR